MPELFANAAQEKKPRVLRRLSELAEIWTEASYYDDPTLAQVRQCIASGQTTVRVEDDSIKNTLRSIEAPWLMPATHGEANTPYCDLPAANMMPHILPNSSRSIRPENMRALQLPGGSADRDLIHAVKDFLEDVKTIEDPFTKFDDERAAMHIDDLGQLNYTNEAGDSMGDTYYGWSRAFCEKMKARSRESESGRARRSYSETSSTSVSGSPRKRRRFGMPEGRSRSSTRERSRSISLERPGHGLGMSTVSSVPQAQQHVHLQPPPPHPSATPLYVPGMPGMPIMSPMPATTMSVPPRPPKWFGPWPPPPPPPPPSLGGFAPLPFPQQGHVPQSKGRR